MFTVITYDVVDDARRARLASLLLDYGKRVQKSVFEAHIDERQFLRLKAAAEAHIDMQTDSIRYYTLCRRCLPTTQVSGWGHIPDDESDSVFIV